MTDLLFSISREIEHGCTECGLCIPECVFLQRRGTPKAIVQHWDPTDPDQRQMPFECSLCGLCTAVCPEPIQPDRLFPLLRQAVVKQYGLPSGRYRGLLNYERLGCSPLLTAAALPSGCDTVFFPGCALAGQLPHTILRVYDHLRQTIPDLGLVLDCCSKPSEDLGLTEVTDQRFHTLTKALKAQNIRRILVACPNCWQKFQRDDNEWIIETVYQSLAQHPPAPCNQRAPVRVHDPCPSRFDRPTQQAVRQLIGADLLPEMAHSGPTTQCCGAGGAVDRLDPAMAQQWNQSRLQESQGAALVSYCAECVTRLSAESSTCQHLLARLFPETIQSTSKRPRWWHYIHRWWLKRQILRIKGVNRVQLRRQRRWKKQ